MLNRPDTTIVGIQGKMPRVHDSAFIGIIGDVEIGFDDMLADGALAMPAKCIPSRKLWSS